MPKKKRKPQRQAVKCAKCCSVIKPLDIKRCSMCRSTTYCSRACQVAHWPKHKHCCFNAELTDVLRKTGHYSFGDAALKGDTAAVRTMVESGFSVEYTDREGCTAVFASASGGKLQTLVFLVEECGASLTHRDTFGQTPLHDAALDGRGACVR